MSYLDLNVFLTAFETNAVSASKYFYATTERLLKLICIWLQIDGPTLQDMDMQDVSEVAPDATRAECKLLLRSARDMQLERDDSQATAKSESDLSAPVVETAYAVIFGCPRS